MAIINAIKTGNWSNANIWDSNSVPTTGDEVHPNGFAVTIDQNLTVASLRGTATTLPYNLAQMCIPLMTTNTAPSGTASSGDSSVNAYKCFDQNTSTNYTTPSTTGVIQYQWAIQKTIKIYQLNCLSTLCPKRWTFQGSNDGSAWTTLDDKSGADVTAFTTFTSTVLANSTGYYYYRINIISTYGISAQINSFEMTEYNVVTTVNNTGGQFLMTTAHTINADIWAGSVGTGLGLVAINISTETATINGNMPSQPMGIITQTYGVSMAGSGNLYFNGYIATGTQAYNHGLISTCTGTVTVTGLITGTGTTNNIAINIASASGTVNLNGGITNNGGAACVFSGAFNLNINANVTSTVGVVYIDNSTGTTIINGNLITNSNGCISQSAGSLSVIGDTSGISGYAINFSTADNTKSFTFLGHINTSSGGGNIYYSASCNGTFTSSSGALFTFGTAVFSISHSGSGTLTINGDVTFNVSSPTGVNGFFSISGSASKMIINGNVTGSNTGVANSNNICMQGSNCELLINGNLTAGGFAHSYGMILLYNATGQKLTVTGNITGGSVSGSYAVYAYTASMASKIYCNGTVYGGSNSSAYAIYLANIIAIVDVTNVACGSGGGVAIYSGGAQPSWVIRGNETYMNGVCPVYSVVNQVWKVDPSAAQIFTLQDVNNTNITFNNSFVSSNQASPSDVRYGVAYGPSSVLVGTAYIPPASSVGYGVLVDNTVGSAVITGAQMTSFLTPIAKTTDIPAMITPGQVWDGLDIASGTGATRLKNCATVATTGDQITGLS